jgi:hypothetical protein
MEMNTNTPTNPQAAVSNSAPDSPLAASIALLRCPATGETLSLETDAQGQYAINASRTLRYQVRDGVVLFVTGRQ